MDNIAKRLLTDLPYYAAQNLKIKPKTGKFTKLELNRAQLYLHGEIERQKKETGKVRVIIIKGRQQGISTYIGARLYHKTVCNPAILTFIFAHDSDASDSLFTMVRNFYEFSDEAFRPILGTSNAKELLFPSLKSGYKVGTAGTKGLGRSKTYQLVHWSEVAYSPNCDEHAAGILQTVADQPGTEILMESTANGQGDFLHRLSMEALSGESDWRLVFLPWYWQVDYVRPVEGDIRLDDTEQSYLDLYGKDGLTIGHLIWRRAKIKEFEHDLLRFMREYPINVQEAFAASDEESYIKASDVIRARKAQPINTTAPLVIGIDPAREGKDRIAYTHRVGRNVTLMGRMRPMTTTNLAGEIAIMIRKYNPMMIFLDVGGLGIGIYDMLVDMGYSNIVKSVNFGSKAIADDKYINKRAEMYAEAKIWLESEPCCIYDNNDTKRDVETLQSELTSVRYKWDRNQRLQLESKEDMRKRGLPSPDIADSFVLTFAQPVARTAEYKHNISQPIQASLSWDPFA